MNTDPKREHLYPKPECATGRLCRGRERRSPEHMEAWDTGPIVRDLSPPLKGYHTSKKMLDTDYEDTIY